MKQFRYLPFTVVQMAALIVSMAFSIFFRNPSSSGRSEDGAYRRIDDVEESEGGNEADPFDVSIPLDFLDGTPIDEDGFLAKMRLSRYAQTALAFLLLILDTTLAWYMDANDSSPKNFAPSLLQLMFSLNILYLSVRHIFQVKVKAHQTSVNHMCCVVALATALSATRLLLPESLTSVPKAPFIRIFEYSSLALNLGLLAIVSLTDRAPELHFPPDRIYSAKTLSSSVLTMSANVTGYVRESILSVLLFAYVNPVIRLGRKAESLETRDLPIVPANLRATPIFTSFRRVYKLIELPRMWQSYAGTEWELLYKLFIFHRSTILRLVGWKVVSGVMRYVPAYFQQGLIHSLEISDTGENPDASWGWFYCVGLFISTLLHYVLYEQVKLRLTEFQTRLRVQLITMLFAKTLVRKNIASAAAPITDPSSPVPATPSTITSSSTLPSSSAPETVPLLAESYIVPIEEAPTEIKAEEVFSTKAQILTIMTTDVDRVCEFASNIFTFIDAPIEILSGTVLLHRLLGASCFWGMAAAFSCFFVNYWAGQKVVELQGNLIQSQGERVSLINEILRGIRMVKLMALERSLEKRVLAIRERELSYHMRKYHFEVLFRVIWEVSAFLVALVSFGHFAVVKRMPFSPSIAFTSLSILIELKFPLTTLPETYIKMLKSLVSIRRIANYVHLPEVTPVPLLHEQATLDIALINATISWPHSGEISASTPPTAALTPRGGFVLVDLTLEFPKGALSLICGKTGSGKTLLLLSLLGEADVLSGQIICPRPPPDTLENFAALDHISAEDWVVPGVCAYVPQTAWLRNASIRENILFNLPFDEERYHRTLEACALLSDLQILPDGDSSEIGEGGVNLSGGQKARVSLARAIYSRASVLFLDDVLSAVDPGTALHIFKDALTGSLVKGRTVILVSHNIGLCVSGAAYVVVLQNGRTAYAGNREDFQRHGIMQTQSTNPDSQKAKETVSSGVKETIEATHAERVEPEASSDSEITDIRSTADDSQTLTNPDSQKAKETVSSGVKETIEATHAERVEPEASSDSEITDDSQTLQPPRQRRLEQLGEEETRAIGQIRQNAWAAYITASGGMLFWTITIVPLLIVAGTPVVTSGWLRYWSSVTEQERLGQVGKSPLFYLAVYAALSAAGLFMVAVRWMLQYNGSIRASTILHKRLLAAVLFGRIRFHDTTNRGRFLNCFGKNFETIDSSLANQLGETAQYGLSTITTLISIIYVSGWKFLLVALVISVMYYGVVRIRGQPTRQTTRLDSVTRSPLYTIYEDSIAGIAVLRAFGAGSMFLREMHQHADTNTNANYWMLRVNGWPSIYFKLLSAQLIGITAVFVIFDKRIDASFAGFALTFASTITLDLLFMTQTFVGLQQSMIDLELVEELRELPQEPPEYIKPRPAASWPEEGAIEVENLVIRYAPDPPNVLHGLNFTVEPRSKIGVLGRTGGGKSTLALSFFRFVEATEGKIVIDGVDISQIGLTDLRSRLTIIPQHPTILSGTLRSTVDVFGEYEDHEIYEALRCVALIPTAGTPGATVNANTFRNLNSPVAEGGENYSSGERQLICVARAILKRSKVLFMDEATASVDYATEQLIRKTIRAQFPDSTVITIAHRPRTVIDYDKIMVLDHGRIVEFDRPNVLLANSKSKLYALCKDTGDLADLQLMANKAAAERQSHLRSI